jgi:hypothetical protein
MTEKHMLRASSYTLTEQALLGLFYIQRYRFLTTSQFARISAYKLSSASDQLRMLERRGFLGYFGNTGLCGHGKTPKVYYLKPVRVGKRLFVKAIFRLN